MSTASRSLRPPKLSSTSRADDALPGGADPRRKSRLPPLLEALRPKQWTKNVLLLAGLLFTIGQPLDQVRHLAQALSAFFLFCLLSGSTYLINDILDIESDRQHPKKRFRPIPAGKLPVSSAWAFAAIGIGGTLIAAFSLNLKFGLAALTYLVLTLSYSFFLKHIVLVDVLTLASLFVVRAAAGAFAIDVRVSEWLLMCTLLLALFLGLAKRRGELAAQGDRPTTRKILAEYSLPMLDQMITIVAATIIMAYTLYAFFSTGASSPGAFETKRPWLMATIPFVLYGVFRYLYLSHKKGIGETPEAALLEDRPLLINVGLFVLAAAIAMALSR